MQRSPVRVVIRVRQTDSMSDALKIEPDGKSITLNQTTLGVTEMKEEALSFSSDEVLVNSSQDKMFNSVGVPAADAVLQGFHGTILCYGQTGAGKSFTMIGSNNSYPQRGLAPRCLAHIFHEASNRPEFEYTFRFSCLEIYNDTMYDLLSTLPGHERQELSITERNGNVVVKGLLAPEVESEEAALQLLFEAEANRAVAQHQLNQASSRSHVLYMLEVDRRSKVTSGPTVSAKLTLVDLAGSERLKKSSGQEQGAVGVAPPNQAQQQRLAKEAMTINKSLSFLEQATAPRPPIPPKTRATTRAQPTQQSRAPPRRATPTLTAGGSATAPVAWGGGARHR